MAAATTMRGKLRAEERDGDDRQEEQRWPSLRALRARRGGRLLWAGPACLEDGRLRAEGVAGGAFEMVITGDTVVEAPRARRSSFRVDHMRLVAGSTSDRNSWVRALTAARREACITTRYELLGQAGSGHFGKVLVARKRMPSDSSTMTESMSPQTSAAFRDLEGVVAIKEVETGADGCGRVSGEISVMRALHASSSSPFLVQLQDCVHQGGFSYMVMDFSSAGDLYQLLRERLDMPMTLEGARVFIGEVLLGMEHMHNHGIVHRDIKPENVFVSRSGHVKLGDFGISKQLPRDTYLNEFGRTSTDCGTPPYMAPEQTLGLPHGLPVDYWQLGCLLYELYVGHSPFWIDCGPDMDKDVSRRFTYYNIRNGHWCFPRYLPVDDSAKAMVMELLQVDWRKRPKSAAQVRRHSFFAGMDWGALARGEATPWAVPMAEADVPSPGHYFQRVGERLTDAQWGCQPVCEVRWVQRGRIVSSGMTKAALSYLSRSLGLAPRKSRVVPQLC